MRRTRQGTGGEPGRGLRLYVDFPWDSSACMGTGAYSETMVRALAHAAPEATLTLVVPLGAPRGIDLPNVAYASLPTVEGVGEGSRQIGLPSFLSAVQADCLFAPASLLPAVKVCATVATVHDLTFDTHPEYYGPGLVEHLRRWFPPTLSLADRIVAISEPVRQDLLFRKRIPLDKVVLIEQPIRESFSEPLPRSEVQRELQSLGVPTPYFFHVSNLSMHKNMEFGVRAFADFLRARPEAPHHLLFAGGGIAASPPPDLLVIARSLGIGNRVHYVGKVPDRTLKVLYQGCESFLFPSLVEGWGLPVAEARALGAKVLASPHVPSALQSERIPLVLEEWVREMTTSDPRSSPLRGQNQEDPGGLLLGVIHQAIAAYAEGASRKGNGIPTSTGLPKSADGQPALSSETRAELAPRAEGSSGEEGPEKSTRSRADGALVAIRADWHSPSGFAQAARGVYNSLRAVGLAPIASAVPKDTIQDKRLWEGPVCLDRGPADLWIHHCPPDYVDLSLPGKHASFFFWETDRLPEPASGLPWAKILTRLDEVWAPSTFVAEVLGRSGVVAPVHHVFPPVDTELYSPGPRRVPESLDLPAGFDPSWTVILFVGTWDPRKRPDILIRCFSKAFSRKDRALLVIKSYVTGDPVQDREILRKWASQSNGSAAHVRVLPGILPPSDMADLFRCATAFASASRGEGYCLPAVQAMSCGKPVLAAGWSAFRDYVTIPVEFAVLPIPREVKLPGYSPDQHWAEIDEKDLVRKLRWVHENREQARLLGENGRSWALENAHPAVVGRRLKVRIQNLCKISVPPKPEEVML